ncbi:MAG: nuclear transport factor 2 family protein [Gammaproteobacteria bacterium]
MSTTGDHSARLAALEARLSELEDCEAIRNLVASYGPLADSGDAEGVAALWAEDGVYAVGGFGENAGREAVAALIRAPFHQQLMQDGCAHALGPVHIRIEGDRALAIGYSVVFHRTGESFEAWRVSANRWELEKRNGRWQVRRRRNALLDGDAAARALLAPTDTWI